MPSCGGTENGKMGYLGYLGYLEKPSFIPEIAEIPEIPDIPSQKSQKSQKSICRIYIGYYFIEKSFPLLSIYPLAKKARQCPNHQKSSCHTADIRALLFIAKAMSSMKGQFCFAADFFLHTVTVPWTR
jgi:hypothetical protein